MPCSNNSSFPVAASTSRCSPLRSLFLLACLLQLPGRTVGQGLDVSNDNLGASNRLKGMRAAWQASVQQADRLASTWRNVQQSKGQVPCSRATGNLCGEDTSSSKAAKAALLIATSLPVYDTRNTTQTGGIRLAPEPKDQADCNSCVAYALAASAQSAAAAALRLSTTDVPFPSVRQLFFCVPDVQNAPDCTNGWKLQQALQLLANPKSFGQEGIVAYQCLPMVSLEGLQSLSREELCTASPQCNTKFPKGTFTYTRVVPLVDIWQIQAHIRLHGAAVVTRMALPPGFKQWFGQAPGRAKAVYDNPDASNELSITAGTETNHAVVIAGYDNINNCWIIWSSWGREWADQGFARVRYGQLGIGDPSFTYGLFFKPEKPTEPVVPLVADAQLPAGCYWYKVQPGDYVSLIAIKLGISIEGLLQLNVGRIGVLGELLRPGQQLLACGVNIEAQCSRFDSCFSCQSTPGCSWCYEGNLKDGKPACQGSSKMCARAVKSVSQCPVDSTAAAAAAGGGSAQQVACASLTNCRECLRFTYQCRWCVTGVELSQCQAGTGQCAAWFGQGPKECPRDGDPEAVNSRGSCSDLSDCATCLSYGGSKPQCVWCPVSKKCLAPAAAGPGNKGACSGSQHLTKGSQQCPKGDEG